MTSTNDGKDVKSNQTSGQRGKKYYLGLYHSLKARLGGSESQAERVQYLCEAWRRIHSICRHAAVDSHPILLDFLEKHTAHVTLQTLTEAERTALDETLVSVTQEINDYASERDGKLPWEGELQQRAEWYRGVLGNPWGHPVLKVLLDPEAAPPDEETIIEWVKGERRILFECRVHELVASKKTRDHAISLVGAVMDRRRAGKPPVSDLDLAEEHRDGHVPEQSEPTFEDVLGSQAGFTAKTWEFLTDVEFTLLHKAGRMTRFIELAKLTPLKNGYDRIESLQSRLSKAETAREKRIWKDVNDVAVLIAQMMVTRFLVVPACTGNVRGVFFRCARALVALLPAADVRSNLLELVKHAVTAAHLYVLAKAVHKERSSEDMKPFVCELFVRALTSGMNELEKLKLKPDKELEARQAEKTLALWFLELGRVFGSMRLLGECTLTAFSVHPSRDMYENIRNMPELPPVRMPEQPLEPKLETNTEFGSWASDSRSQTNFVKTSEHLNMKQTQQANVLSTAILNEGEALGLGAELCQDIAVLLSGPRVKTLSWDLDRELLLSNCVGHMERTAGGTRALTTELRYLHLDPKDYQHLREEEDDDENDLYYGIEKGYEHLVELPEPQPETVWDDTLMFDDSNTESAYSTEDEEIVPKPRKKKTKKQTLSSCEDEDPLSNIAEAKKAEKKKERPHSKERSKEDAERNKERKKKPKKERSRSKDKESKKERKKKVKTEKLSSGPLSQLIGVKVERPDDPLDSDCEGKSSIAALFCEENNTNVEYDGQFSMDELKSPDRKTPPAARKNSVSSAVNKNRTDENVDKQPQTSINPEVKTRIAKLLQFRRNKSTTSTESSNSPAQSPAPCPYQTKEEPHIKSEPMSNWVGSKILNPSDLPKEGFTFSQSLALSSMNNEISNLMKTTNKGLDSKNILVSKTINKVIFDYTDTRKACARMVPVKSYSRNRMCSIPELQLRYLESLPEGTEKQEQKLQQPSQNVTPGYSSTPQVKKNPSSHTVKPQNLSQENKNSPREHKTETPRQSVIQRSPVKQSQSHQSSFEDFLKGIHGPKPFVFNTDATERRINKSLIPATQASPVLPNILKPSKATAVAADVPKAEPLTSQSAKPVVQQKKPENAPNTFSRLSYMHKSKQNDAKPKPDAEPDQIALQKSVSDELDKRIAEMRQYKINLANPQRNVATVTNTYASCTKPKESPPRVDIVKLTPPEHLVSPKDTKINEIPSSYRRKDKNAEPSAPPSVQKSALSDKDQQDLINMLKQQNKLNDVRQSKQSSSAMLTNLLNSNPGISIFNNNIQIKAPNQQPTSTSPILNHQVKIPKQNQNLPQTDKKDLKAELISKATILRTAELIHSRIANSRVQQTPTGVQSSSKLNNKYIQTEVNLQIKHAPSPLPVARNEIAKTIMNPSKVSNVDKKYSSPKTDYISVMDAIRKQKTPSRGPNALEMMLKNDAYEKYNSTQSLRNLRIVKQKPEQTYQSTADNQTPVPPSTPVQTKANTQSFKQTETAQPKKHLNVELTSNHPLIKIQDIPKVTDPISQTLNSKTQKESDPFISGIQNSEYDLIGELMDDELRQELGELSSDEEKSYKAPTNTENNKNVFYPGGTVLKNLVSTVTTERKPNTNRNATPKPKDIICKTSNAATQKIVLNPNETVDVKPTVSNKPKLKILSNEKVNIITQPNIQNFSKNMTPQIGQENTTRKDTSQVKPANMDTKKLIITAPPPPSSNVVVIRPDMPYEQYPTLHITEAPVNSENSFVASSNIPAMNTIQLTNFSPVMAPVLIQNSIGLSTLLPVASSPIIAVSNVPQIGRANSCSDQPTLLSSGNIHNTTIKLTSQTEISGAENISMSKLSNETTVIAVPKPPNTFANKAFLLKPDNMAMSKTSSDKVHEITSSVRSASPIELSQQLQNSMKGKSMLKTNITKNKSGVLKPKRKRTIVTNNESLNSISIVKHGDARSYPGPQAANLLNTQSGPEENIIFKATVGKSTELARKARVCDQIPSGVISKMTNPAVPSDTNHETQEKHITEDVKKSIGKTENITSNTDNLYRPVAPNLTIDLNVNDEREMCLKKVEIKTKVELPLLQNAVPLLSTQTQPSPHLEHKTNVLLSARSDQIHLPQTHQAPEIKNNIDTNKICERKVLSEVQEKLTTPCPEKVEGKITINQRLSTENDRIIEVKKEKDKCIDRERLKKKRLAIINRETSFRCCEFVIVLPYAPIKNDCTNAVLGKQTDLSDQKIGSDKLPSPVETRGSSPASTSQLSEFITLNTNTPESPGNIENKSIVTLVKKSQAKRFKAKKGKAADTVTTKKANTDLKKQEQDSKDIVTKGTAQHVTPTRVSNRIRERKIKKSVSESIETNSKIDVQESSSHVVDPLPLARDTEAQTIRKMSLPKPLITKESNKVAASISCEISSKFNVKSAETDLKLDTTRATDASTITKESNKVAASISSDISNKFNVNPAETDIKVDTTKATDVSTITKESNKVAASISCDILSKFNVNPAETDIKVDTTKATDVSTITKESNKAAASISCEISSIFNVKSAETDIKVDTTKATDVSTISKESNQVAASIFCEISNKFNGKSAETDLKINTTKANDVSTLLQNETIHIISSPEYTLELPDPDVKIGARASRELLNLKKTSYKVANESDKNTYQNITAPVQIPVICNDPNNITNISDLKSDEKLVKDTSDLDTLSSISNDDKSQKVTAEKKQIKVICHENGETVEDTITIPTVSLVEKIIAEKNSGKEKNDESLNNNVIAIDSDSDVKVARNNDESEKNGVTLSTDVIPIDSDSDANEDANKKSEAHTCINDIPQSYKNSISFEEIPNRDPNDPLKRTVRVKLPNGKLFKATVYGSMTIDFESLLQDPNLNRLLHSNIKEKKRVLLNVQQLSTTSNEIIDTRIKSIRSEKQTVLDPNVVNLISDEEDNDETVSKKSKLKLTTEFGSYAVKSLNKEHFDKHQTKLLQKCSVKLINCDSKNSLPDIKTDASKNEILNHLKNAILNPDIEENNQIISLEDDIDAIKTVLNTAAPEVIELDDSSDEDIIPKIHPGEKIDDLKNLLLKDLGVADVLTEKTESNKDVEINQKSSSVSNQSKLKKYKAYVEPTKKDYSSKIPYECFVKLQKCDSLVRKMEDEKRISDISTEVIDLDEDLEPKLARSGSFSILNDVVGLDEVAAELTEPDIDRSSPIIDIVETITAFDGPEADSYIEPSIQRIPDYESYETTLCCSDWFDTKKKIRSRLVCHHVFVSEDSVDTTIDSKTDVSTDYESDADVTLCSSTISDHQKTSVKEIGEVPSLQKIMTAYYARDFALDLAKSMTESRNVITCKRKLVVDCNEVAKKISKIDDYVNEEDIGASKSCHQVESNSTIMLETNIEEILTNDVPMSEVNHEENEQDSKVGRIVNHPNVINLKKIVCSYIVNNLVSVILHTKHSKQTEHNHKLTTFQEKMPQDDENITAVDPKCEVIDQDIETVIEMDDSLLMDVNDSKSVKAENSKPNSSIVELSKSDKEVENAEFSKETIQELQFKNITILSPINATEEPFRETTTSPHLLINESEELLEPSTSDTMDETNSNENSPVLTCSGVPLAPATRAMNEATSLELDDNSKEDENSLKITFSEVVLDSKSETLHSTEFLKLAEISEETTSSEVPVELNSEVMTEDVQIKITPPELSTETPHENICPSDLENNYEFSELESNISSQNASADIDKKIVPSAITTELQNYSTTEQDKPAEISSPEKLLESAQDTGVLKKITLSEMPTEMPPHENINDIENIDQIPDHHMDASFATATNCIADSNVSNQDVRADIERDKKVFSEIMSNTKSSENIEQERSDETTSSQKALKSAPEISDMEYVTCSENSDIDKDITLSAEINSTTESFENEDQDKPAQVTALEIPLESAQEICDIEIEKCYENFVIDKETSVSSEISSTTEYPENLEERSADITSSGIPLKSAQEICDIENEICYENFVLDTETTIASEISSTTELSENVEEERSAEITSSGITMESASEISMEYVTCSENSYIDKETTIPAYEMKTTSESSQNVDQDMPTKITIPGIPLEPAQDICETDNMTSDKSSEHNSDTPVKINKDENVEKETILITKNEVLPLEHLDDKALDVISDNKLDVQQTESETVTKLSQNNDQNTKEDKDELHVISEFTPATSCEITESPEEVSSFDSADKDIMFTELKKDSISNVDGNDNLTSLKVEGDSEIDPTPEIRNLEDNSSQNLEESKINTDAGAQDDNENQNNIDNNVPRSSDVGKSKTNNDHGNDTATSSAAVLKQVNEQLLPEIDNLDTVSDDVAIVVEGQPLTINEGKYYCETEIVEVGSPLHSSIVGSPAYEESAFDKLPENIFHDKFARMYKEGKQVLLNGVEYEDPEKGTYYVFTLEKSSDSSANISNSTVESVDQEKQLEESADEILSAERTKESAAIDSNENMEVIIPTKTYSKRNLKRKLILGDITLSVKKRRLSNLKGNIDSRRLSNAKVNDSLYIKEFTRLLEYCSTIEFSYSISFHKDQVDVENILNDWPIRGDIQNENQVHDESDDFEKLFEDLDEKPPYDPLTHSLAEELDTEYVLEEPCKTADSNFSMGFGEGSGRVIQNFDRGGVTKFSAATLSDVKHSQPFLLSENYYDCENENAYISRKADQFEKIKRSIAHIQLRDKVRSFFKKTALELSHDAIKEKQKTSDSETFPFDLDIPTCFEPAPVDVVVQVVQVGQLPVSAAAQNPVTCDPRVTQVSDASPSQCSEENSPRDDSQPGIKTEYTELTTADLSMPMENYQHHIQTMPVESQEAKSMSMTGENIPIETELIKSEVKIELEEETSEDTKIDENMDDTCDLSNSNNHVNNIDYTYHSNNTNVSMGQDSSIQMMQPMTDAYSQQKQQNGAPEKTDQIAHAMSAAGISTTAEPVHNTRAQALVNIISQKIRHSNGNAAQNSINTYSKSSPITAMALQQALAQILPPPLNQTNAPESNQQGQNPTVAPQVLHIVQGKNASGNQITLVDNTQQSVINQNATPVLHILQNKAPNSAPNSGGNPPQQQNTFSGLSLVDTGLQQGGNQLLHIVNTGNQKNTNAGQLLKRVNLLTNLTNVPGSNDQKMVQFVCKSADGKSIQLNAPHQRSMVLRLQPIESPNIQNPQPKPVENQDMSPSPNTPNSGQNKETASQQEIKSRSVYEENYAKFIQSSSVGKPVGGSTSLPKFNQAFGKSSFQDGNQKQPEISSNNTHLPPVNTNNENTECPPAENNSINLEHISQMSSPPLLLRKSPQTSQPQPNLVQQIKQTIAPMNIQTMHGGVIYTRQIPVNIGGGQTINLITVPSTELIDDKQQSEVKFVNQASDIEPSIIKIVPQSAPNAEVTQDESNNHANVSNENVQNPQPQPVLTQMRIKLPMLSKTPQMVSGARVVRPSFFQIQRNVIGGANQQVYQQLVLTAAPPLGQQTIRLPQGQAVRPKAPSDAQSSPESQMSSSTLEQLREFDMVLEQVKERSTVQPNSSGFKLNATSSDTTDSNVSGSSTPVETSQPVLYSIGGSQQLNVAYVNRKAAVATPSTSTFVRSPDSTGIADSPSSSNQAQSSQSVSNEPSSSGTSSQSRPRVSSKSKSRPKSSHSQVKINPVPPKPATQKPLEDEQTTQRILYILAEYKEQVENSPDKDKPAPRRRSNPPSNPGSSKRKKSSSGSRRPGARDSSPVQGDDACRTMGSEDSSCGTSQGDCTESCMETHSPQDSPRKVARKLTFEQETAANQPRPQPQRNVIVADGQTITVARGAGGKPATAVLMPANYILPVSMVKGGQQIAIVTNRGPKLLTVGGGEGGATNALLLQRLIGPAGLKPVLARPGVRHVRLPTAALHNLQTFNLASASATTVQPPDSTNTASPAPAPTPPELIETRAEASPWTERESEPARQERAATPEGSEPWNMPTSSDAQEYSYEETVRAENMDRTVLDPIPDRYSPDMEAQRIFDKMFDVESKKCFIVDSQDEPHCGYGVEASEEDKGYQVVQKREGPTQRAHRVTHISAAALRHKYAILEHELRLQKSLSEECEDLGVDSPSASELFPEAELLFAASPAQDPPEAPHHNHHTPQPTLLNQTIQADIDDQIATDQVLPREENPPNRRLDVNLGLEDVGIVTVSDDGMQATIALDQEEFARSHPNTTFHSEPSDTEVHQPFTITGIKGGRQISTIFHANRVPATVLMTAPQATTVISQTADPGQGSIKYSDIDHMITTLPGTHANNVNLNSVLVKDDGLTRFENILTDSRELHLSNTASAIVHPTGNATQVIRRVCYDEGKRERDARFLMDEPDTLIAGDDAKMVAEDSSRDATMESIVEDVDDDNSSSERHAELFWESNSASERSESRRPLDYSSDSEKCCKSPSFDETNSTDSSGLGSHMRHDSVIKEARLERSGSAEGSSADDTHPPLRTYPPKRMYHNPEAEMERSLSGKTRAGERSPDLVEGRRRTSVRGVVKRGCHCCNGSPPRPKKPRQRKPTLDFNTSN